MIMHLLDIINNFIGIYVEEYNIKLQGKMEEI